ncbi:MAG: L,D-transpeptidase [Deltaproteobacteria bacterium]|nr:L,D-transpeptidase [Deltaproteobacteria bacterium]
MALRLVFIVLCLLENAARASAQVEPEPEQQLKATSFSVVEIVPRRTEHADTGVLLRPERFAPLVGHVARGARIGVRGQVEVADSGRCDASIYYALEPFGYLCADDAQASAQPLTTGTVLELITGSPLPYEYVMVNIPEGELVPLWGSPSDIVNGNSAKRMLGRGDSIAVEPQTMQVEGQRYRVSVDGDLVSTEHTYKLRRFSLWQGSAIDQETHLPFGWVTPRKAPVFDAPRGNKVRELVRRERIDIFEEQLVNNRRWLRIAENEFVRANDINEVRFSPRPEGTNQHPQWIDVDLGEQVVVAYRGETPQYATLISSGRPPNRTPRGDYPIWGKASSISMKSQPYDDKPYYVDRVPWVLFFQAHNALHGAYWHDRFGIMKSHGCINLSPKDARFLFEWVEPKLPAGWTALHFSDLSKTPVVHVRNSLYRKPFRQERKIGPPDPKEEAERLAQAEARRELERQEQALQQSESDEALDSSRPEEEKEQQ